MAKSVVSDPTVAGREVADVAIEHGHGDGSVFDEGAELALAGAQLFLGALALGNVSGKAENVLRCARGIAQKGKFYAGRNAATVPQEVALVKVEMIELSFDHALKSVQIQLDVIRMSELVKHADGNRLFGGAAEHAPVSGVDREAAIFDLGDGNSEFSAPEDGAEFLLAFTDGEFIGPALRDVQKGDHRTDRLPTSAQRVGPVFDREAGAIASPKDFVVGMRALSRTKRLNDAAVLNSEWCAVGMGMVKKQVTV